MPRWKLSAVTAIISLVGALVWLALGRAVSGLLWAAISIGWLVTSIIQCKRHDGPEPPLIPFLLRRFSRLILFWS
jgi:hypothetical protein